MHKSRVLIVEDDSSLREAIVDTVELAGFSQTSVESAEEALIHIERTRPALIVSDVQMEGMGGINLLKKICRMYPEIPFLLMTAYGNISDAVDAMRNGAVDYLTKPFEPDELIEKIKFYMPQHVQSANDPVAEDPDSKALLSLANRAAQSDATILISGESGTGKEVLARFIHDHSPQKDKAFVAINCAAIPENMLEATLFGYEKGAFTGAVKATPGKFELANNGTLLLDEISEMDLALQAKILRVLQEREVERIGSNKLIQLKVRVIATTNRDLKEEVNAKRFREDLYYRLNVFPLNWRPIRQRPKDIIPMVNYLLNRHLNPLGKRIPQLSDKAKEILKAHSWPGNARELDNVIQRALILCNGDTIQVDDLRLDVALNMTIDDKSSNKNNETDPILNALKEFDGNRKKICDALGISERTLRYKLAKLRKEGAEV